MKHPTIARSLCILAIFFLLTNTVKAYRVHIFATPDSVASTVNTCIALVRDCDEGPVMCQAEETICNDGPLLDCDVPDGQWSCAQLNKTRSGAVGEIHYPTDGASCFAYRGYQDGTWDFNPANCP